MRRARSEHREFCGAGKGGKGIGLAEGAGGRTGSARKSGPSTGFSVYRGLFSGPRALSSPPPAATPFRSLLPWGGGASLPGPRGTGGEGKGGNGDGLGRGRWGPDGLAASVRPSHRFSVYEDYISGPRCDLVTTDCDYPLQESLPVGRVSEEDHVPPFRFTRVKRVHSHDESLVQAYRWTHRIAWNSKCPQLK